jgi:hypothetical protein
MYTEPERLNSEVEITNVTHPWEDTSLRLVRAGRYIPTMSCPIGMNELSWAGQQLIGVRTKVITLGLFKHTTQVTINIKYVQVEMDDHTAQDSNPVMNNGGLFLSLHCFN